MSTNENKAPKATDLVPSALVQGLNLANRAPLEPPIFPGYKWVYRVSYHSGEIRAYISTKQSPKFVTIYEFATLRRVRRVQYKLWSYHDCYADALVAGLKMHEKAVHALELELAKHRSYISALVNQNTPKYCDETPERYDELMAKGGNKDPNSLV